MAKGKDQHMYSSNQEDLIRIANEAIFLGRRVYLEPGHLTIYALPATWKKKEIKERKLAARREKQDDEY